MPRKETALILVVEDNKADADLVVDGLTEAPPVVSVEVVGDGRAALEFVRNGHGRNGARRPGAAAVLNKPMRLADYRELLRAVACLWLEHAMLPRAPL